MRITKKDDLLCGGDVVDMVAERNKKVKKELRATVVHLKLHGATSFECTA